MSEIDDKFFAERKEKISAAWKRYTEDISYRRALAKKAAERRRLEAANQAFGGQTERLKALYGISDPTSPSESEGSGQSETSGIRGEGRTNRR